MTHDPIDGVVSEGAVAPTFTLPGTDGGDVGEHSLTDYLAAGPVVLAFYLYDFHPACTEQLCSLRDLGWIDLHPNARTLAVSTDSAFSHRAFADEHGLGFPLLSDSDGRVAESYGVLLDEHADHRRVSNRSVFVLDADGTVRYAWVADHPKTQPDWHNVRGVLDGLEDD